MHRIVSAFRLRARSVSERLRRFFVVALLLRTLQEMSDDDGTHMAASVAYYALFSLFPLLLGLIAIMSIFLEPEDLQNRLIDFTADYLPGSKELIETNVDAVLRLRGAVGAFAVVGLLWSSSAIFGAVTRAVNRAWDVHRDRPLYVSKPRQMAMALGVGALFLLSLTAATFARSATRLANYDLPGLDFLVNVFARVLFQGGSFVLMLCVFLFVYKFVPNTKTYWRYIWPGAVLAAVLFELAKNLFISYLNRFASFENVYGSLTPVIILLLWAYVSSLILIVGAELSSEYGRMRHGVARGVLLHPKEH